MLEKSRRMWFLIGIILLVMSFGFCVSAVEVMQPEDASIDWQQCAGQEINILDIAHSTSMILEPMIPQFEKLTGIKVNHLMMDENKMRVKRTEDLLAGAGRYDIHQIGLTIVPQYYKAKWLEDLTPFIGDASLTDPEFFDYEGIGKPLRDGQIFNDYICAIPNMFCGVYPHYRTDILAEAGMWFPQEWEDVPSLYMPKLKTFMSNTYKIPAFVTRGKKGAGANTAYASMLHRDWGGEWFDEKGKPIFNSPEGVAALECYADCMDPANGAPIGGEGLGMYEIRQMFYLGQVASILTSGDLVGMFDDPTTSNIVGKWDATIAPRGPVKRTCLLWTWAYGMSSHSKKKDAAWLFIQWATSPATMLQWGAQVPPPRLSLWESEEFRKIREIHPGWVDAERWALLFGMPDCQPLIPEFPEWGEYYGIAIANVIAGRQTAQEALDLACKQVAKVVGYSE